jgi:hypothetical protein
LVAWQVYFLYLTSYWSRGKYILCIFLLIAPLVAPLVAPLKTSLLL